MTYSVYCIENILDNKRYIGSTAKVSSVRWSQHLYLLRKGCHSSKHLQYSWNRYGESNFKFYILDSILHNNILLSKREEFWIHKYKSNKDTYGYNLREVATSNLGIKFGPLSQKQKNKLSNILTGRTITWGNSISKAKKGKSSPLKGRLVISREYRICECLCKAQFLTKSNSKQRFIWGHNMKAKRGLIN